MRFLREIDHAIPRVFRPNEAPSRNVQVEPLAMLRLPVLVKLGLAPV